MGISGISFSVELDRTIKGVKINDKPFFPMVLTFDGPSGKRNMYFDSFDLDIDIDGPKSIYVEAHDPKDIDGYPIKDYPTVSEVEDGKISEFLVRCGDKDHDIFPVKVSGLTLYQNGYRHDMSDEVCQKLTDAFTVTKIKNDFPKPEECLVCKEIDGEKKWVPQAPPPKDNVNQKEILNELKELGIWERDHEKDPLSKIKNATIKSGFSDHIGRVYFGNNMFSVDVRKREDGKQFIDVDLFAPINVKSSTEERLFNFPENDISELVENHLPSEKTTNAITIFNPEGITNYNSLKEIITAELFKNGLISAECIPAYARMQKERSGFYQQFQRKYDSLENISIHRLTFPQELVGKTKLDPCEVSDLGYYYHRLAELTATPGQELTERTFKTVAEMIKDGLSQQRILTVYLDIKKRMNLGPRNIGLSNVLNNPQIKGMIEAQNAAKTRNFER